MGPENRDPKFGMLVNPILGCSVGDLVSRLSNGPYGTY